MAATTVHELRLEDKVKLQGILHVLDLFSNLDRDMPLQMIRTMLLVCIKEGQGPNEVSRELGVANAVSSRHLSDLGEIDRYHNDGYNLVEQRVDVTDRRYRRSYLTAKGVTFRNELLRA